MHNGTARIMATIARWYERRANRAPVRAAARWARATETRREANARTHRPVDTTTPLRSLRPPDHNHRWHYANMAAVYVCVAGIVGIVFAVGLTAEPYERPRASASSADSGGTDPGPSPPVGPAANALEELGVQGRAPLTGYQRDSFRHWITRNGCDTHARILERDGTARSFIRDRDGCVVGVRIATGPYTGRQLLELPGPGSDIAIDHVVALADAWQSGAQQLSTKKREQLANDPENLLAVDNDAHDAKRGRNAASWLPPNRAYHCDYVARQVAIKSKYKLWVTPREHAAITRVLNRCPGHPLPT